MNRQRLDAEAIRDGLLAVAGRLEARRGGPAFADLTVPRRTVYLMSVRTGPGSSASDFGRLFNRADPGSIVARRDESVVAPQALFFLNDPFVNEMARALAARLRARRAGGRGATHPPPPCPRPGAAAVPRRDRPLPAVAGPGRGG